MLRTVTNTRGKHALSCEDFEMKYHKLIYFMGVGWFILSLSIVLIEGIPLCLFLLCLCISEENSN